MNERQELGLLLMGLGLVPIGYALGLLDFLTHPKPGPGTGPRNMTIAIAKEQCAFLPVQADYGQVRILTPDGLSPVQDAVIMFASARSVPDLGSFVNMGRTDANGFGPELHWSWWDSGWMYAVDPQGRYEPSGVVGLC